MVKTKSKRSPLHLFPIEPNGPGRALEGEGHFISETYEGASDNGAWHNMDDFQAQMRDLIDRLSKWAGDRKDVVREAHLAIKSRGHLLFLVVMKAREFNSDLEDELTSLDIDVANAPGFNLLRLEVLAIPDCPADCVDSFLTKG